MGINAADSVRCSTNILQDRQAGVLTFDKGVDGKDIVVVNSNKLSEISPAHVPFSKEEIAERYCKDPTAIFDFSSKGDSSEATAKIMNGKYYFQAYNDK